MGWNGEVCCGRGAGGCGGAYIWTGEVACPGWGACAIIGGGGGGGGIAPVGIGGDDAWCG